MGLAEKSVQPFTCGLPVWFWEDVPRSWLTASPWCRLLRSGSQAVVSRLTLLHYAFRGVSDQRFHDAGKDAGYPRLKLLNQTRCAWFKVSCLTGPDGPYEIPLDVAGFHLLISIELMDRPVMA